MIVIDPVAAQFICLGLVAADLIARTYRIQWILLGLGHRVSFGEAFTLNTFGDAACALTPLRVGGEPARLAGMLRSRVPPAAAFVAISLEVLAVWPVIVVAVGWLAWRYAPDWWATMGPDLIGAARRSWPLVLGVTALSLAVWLETRRVTSPLRHQLRRPIRRALVYWRRMPWWPIIASFPMTFIGLVARVAILPVLTLTLPHPPPQGAVWFGSFALLYSQLLLPTPSGAGAVELGFLGGAAGDLGGHERWLLVAWRMYTNGVGLIIGLALAGKFYGWDAIRRLVRRSTAELR